MSKLLFSELYVLQWISDLNFQLSTQLLIHSTSHYPPFCIFHSSFLPSFKNVLFGLTKSVAQRENVLC